MHGIHHDVNDRIESAADLFRVEVLDKVCRTAYVGKENGDFFPFSFDKSSRSENFFSKVTGNNGCRGALLGKASLPRPRCVKSLAALLAEFCPGPVGISAMRA
jgi:hypothetical protein